MSSFYQDIREYIQRLIEEKHINIDEKLPSERELGDLFQSSRATVREALVKLEHEGLIFRSNRRGWFVAPRRFVINLTQKVNFNEMAIAQSRIPSTHVSYAGSVSIDEHLQRELDIKGKTCFCLSRVRSLDGRCVMAEQIYLDIKKFPDLKKHDLSLSVTDLLRHKYSVEINREVSNIQVIALDENLANQLEVNNGAPCVKIIRRRFNQLDELTDFNIEYWVHNAIEMEVEGI